jgi:endonuclease/exonuclease/phosphatase family metal-dependent hydrolase
VLDALIRDTAADVVALQGCWGPIRINWPADWQIVRHGEFLIASRFPLRDVPLAVGNSPPQPRPPRKLLHCVVESPDGEFPVVAVHLPSPRDGIEQVVDRSTLVRPSRSGPLEAQIDLRRQAAEEAAQYVGGLSDEVIVAGDFNMPTDSAIYRQVWAGLTNAFSRCGWGFGYTEWPSSRVCRFGVRIDHVLTGPAWRPQRCWVGPDVGSDHLPVVADLGLR